MLRQFQIAGRDAEGGILIEQSVRDGETAQEVTQRMECSAQRERFDAGALAILEISEHFLGRELGQRERLVREPLEKRLDLEFEQAVMPDRKLSLSEAVEVLSKEFFVH